MAKKTEKSFEEQLKRLEEIVNVLDNDDTPLEEMMKVYEEGINLTKELRTFLDTAEMKVREINKTASIDNDTAPF